MLDRLRARLRNPRSWFIIGAIVVVYVTAGVLGLVLKEILTQGTDNVLLSFYSAWVEDIIFFTIIGIAVMAYTEPFRPDSAAFHERIRAFYGTRAPRALQEYAKEELKRYGGYCPSALRVMTITEYNEALNSFKVEVYGKFIIRNLFEDTDYHDKTLIQVTPDFYDDPPRPMGHILWITVDDDDKLATGVREILYPDGYNTKVDIDIAQNGEVEYEFQYWMWHKLGELNTHNPQRVVQDYKMKVRNLLSDMVVQIEYDATKESLEIGPGKTHLFDRIENATPREAVFKFRFRGAVAPKENNG